MQQVLGDRYRVERLVERGVLTDDYEATDLTLERRVLLKVLKEELDEEPAVRQLFEEAAHGAAVLNHPNIVSTLDSGDDDGISYVVTEYVDDPTLNEVLANGPLPPRRVAEVGVDVASALAYAHDQGALFRGLSPRSVVLDPDGEARLRDFGFTRVAERARSLDRDARIAEAAYVAPERVRGEPADVRTDLYGLGLVLYEAATGRPAAMGDSPGELARQQLEVHPPRPSEVNPAVPRELESIMARMLAKNRDARLPNANAVLQELTALLDSGALDDAGVAVGAAPPPPPIPPPMAPQYEDDDFYEPEEPIAAAAAAAAAATGGAAAGQGHIVRIGANDSTTVLSTPPPDYRYDDQERRQPWILWAALAGVVLIVILIILALSGGGGGGSSTVAVPNVVNQTQDDAIATLTRAGLKANPVSIPNDTVAQGVVYAEDPASGKKVKKGSTVNLSVSSGPSETTTTSSSSSSTTLATATTVKHTTTTIKRTTTTIRRVTTTAPHPPTTHATTPTTLPTPTTATTSVTPVT
ncbi:MAG: serine/threonine protein kinase [Acidimicrobiia bacterium]|nr:serine/threonine protein kinase [Acidimicrobiia bacterium]